MKEDKSTLSAKGAKATKNEGISSRRKKCAVRRTTLDTETKSPHFLWLWRKTACEKTSKEGPGFEPAGLAPRHPFSKRGGFQKPRPSTKQHRKWERRDSNPLNRKAPVLQTDAALQLRRTPRKSTLPENQSRNKKPPKPNGFGGEECPVEQRLKTQTHLKNSRNPKPITTIITAITARTRRARFEPRIAQRIGNRRGRMRELAYLEKLGKHEIASPGPPDSGQTCDSENHNPQRRKLSRADI